MLTRVKTASLYGIDALNVEVEVNIRNGKHLINLIGLGDSAVKEAKDRVTSALRHLGVRLKGNVLINLSPAEMRKEGALFDLPIAVGILAAFRIIPPAALEKRKFYGELSLDGRIMPVRGILALTINALQHGAEEVIVPKGNEREASLLSAISVVALSSLAELVAFLNGREFETAATEPPDKDVQFIATAPPREFSDVWGQEGAKRALTIAAAGGHNALMIGPPGCGKSMLAERFSGILPDLSPQEKLEVIKIHSVAGLPVELALSGARPFRNPHHLVSEAGLIGGGSIPKPGEISLAHNGVLFLDELPEFRRGAIEALRQPLESGVARIARAKASLDFPANFQLIAAMNACPCGRLGCEDKECLCSRSAIASYLKKLSQPILDRIDLHVELSSVPIGELAGRKRQAQPDGILGATIRRARERQIDRQGKLNSALTGEEIGTHFKINSQCIVLLERAASKINLSARSFVRIFRVAASIADLSEKDCIVESNVAEAIGFRSLERLQQYCA